MNRCHRAWFAAAVLVCVLYAALSVVVAAVAYAETDAQTTERALAQANRTAQLAYPDRPNLCNGQLSLDNFPASEPLSRGDGEAHGWALSGDEYVWNFAACRASIRAGLNSYSLCRAVEHEYFHFVLGPDHPTGSVLDPEHHFTECEVAEPVRVWRSRTVVTRAGRSVRVSRARFCGLRRMHRISWTRTAKRVGDPKCSA